MAHWKERDHWLSNEVHFARNEIWDGERFKELSWFWNPEASVEKPLYKSYVLITF